MTMQRDVFLADDARGDAVDRSEPARRQDGAAGSVRRHLVDRLHGGLVQHVTALSLAVDAVDLAHTAGANDPRVRAALGTARRLADLAIADCRALLRELDGRGA